jgi:putative isomerase
LRTLILLLIAVSFSTCSSDTSSKDTTHTSLGKTRLPIHLLKNVTPGILSDKGAWFGIQLPQEGSIGLDKPLIMSDSNGYWMTEPLLSLDVLENGSTASFDIETYTLPGSLYQEMQSKQSTVHLQTIFIDEHSVLLECVIRNKSNKVMDYQLNWQLPSSPKTIGNKAEYDLGNATLTIQWDSSAAINSTQASIIKLEPNLNHKSYIVIQHRFKTENTLNRFNFDHSYCSEFFRENQERWHNYLKPYKQLSPPKQILAIKCIQTLINNWRAPQGELKHAGLFPSYHYKGFHGFWAWDSWKHAAALALFEPDLAKEQIQAMFDFQNEVGMIADCVFRDTLIETHNWRNTKAPLAAWAVYEVFRKTGDKDFVAKMLPQLLRYHKWWYTERDYNKNGLCEYGSTDGTRIAAAWESGMDNAVRFDSSKLIKTSATAWSLNQESVDLNSYLFAEKMFLIDLLKATNQNELVRQFEEEAADLKIKIQEHFYDVETGYFYDINTNNQSKIKVIGPEAWTCLWAVTASKEQAQEVARKIMSPKHFNSLVPFPTLSVSHPKFDPDNGYWRGPVWLDQAYFALVGMNTYGYTEEANRLKEKIFQNAEGLLEPQVALRENYDPRNGKGLNAKHFSWSAAHLLLLLKRK